MPAEEVEIHTEKARQNGLLFLRSGIQRDFVGLLLGLDLCSFFTATMILQTSGILDLSPNILIGKIMFSAMRFWTVPCSLHLNEVRIGAQKVGLFLDNYIQTESFVPFQSHKHPVV